MIDDDDLRMDLDEMLTEKPTTCRDAGRKGGLSTRDRGGMKFYQEIGRKGGFARWEKEKKRKEGEGA